jgi:YHS domain-containing protein
MIDLLLPLAVALLLSRPFWRFVMNRIRRSTSSRARTAAPSAVHKERDPVCGTFVVPSAAVVVSDGSRRLFFCSAACRDRYRARTA